MGRKLPIRGILSCIKLDLFFFIISILELVIVRNITNSFFCILQIFTKSMSRDNYNKIHKTSNKFVLLQSHLDLENNLLIGLKILERINMNYIMLVLTPE